MTDRSTRPPALAWSVGFGAVGVMLLLLGLAGGNETLTVLGVTAGTLSLVAVLIWRSQLIAAWRSRRESGSHGG